MIEFESRIDPSLSETVEDRQSSEETRREPNKRAVPQEDVEVTPKRTKRRFSAGEKLRILAVADGCTKHGELGALLRREGLYSSQIATWRTLRETGELDALTSKKRGRKAAIVNPLSKQLADAERKNRILTKKLEQAETIISFQKKFAEMFGKIITLPEELEKIF